MRDSFSTYHPAISFFYFAGVLTFSMFVMHPFFLAASAISALSYLAFLKGAKRVLLHLFIFLPMALLIALGNPLFNHEGTTILWYAKSQNPITLESIYFGAASGTMFLSVLLWFSCYTHVMTSDKFIYLFGRVIPSLSLVLSMVLRFVPRYQKHLGHIRRSQKGIGQDTSQGSLTSRIRNGIKILSMMTTWALESAIDTADSMNARGYGLGGRTSFSIFYFDRRDRKMAIILGILFALVAGGVLMGWISVRYFPTMRFSASTGQSFIAAASFLAFCLIPLGAGLWEEVIWRRSRLKI